MLEQEPINSGINDIQKQFFSELVEAYMPHKTNMRVDALRGNGEYHDLIENDSAARYFIGDLMTIDLLFSCTNIFNNEQDFVASMWQLVVRDEDPQPDGSKIVKSLEYTVMQQNEDWTADFKESTQVHSSEGEIVHSDDSQVLTSLIKQKNQMEGVNKQAYDDLVMAITKHVLSKDKELKKIEDYTFTVDHLKTAEIILESLDPNKAIKIA